MYCEQQINIPPELPDILKQFTKAAIRTQPHDILQWSAAYFSALSKGDTLPCPKETLCLVTLCPTDTGLTPGLLKVLHKQLALKETISKEEMQQKRKCLCLPSEQLDTLLALGNFNDNIHWMHFFALGGTIISTLRYVCEILTGNGEGLYTYLAHLDGEIPQDQIRQFHKQPAGVCHQAEWDDSTGKKTTGKKKNNWQKNNWQKKQKIIGEIEGETKRTGKSRKELILLLILQINSIL
uniref:Ropporin-1-like protein n=1 Tax=Oncorhynchus tshawytscha TaxID=74940 RepID=A0A8C8C4W1_ONCTS